MRGLDPTRSPINPQITYRAAVPGDKAFLTEMLALSVDAMTIDKIPTRPLIANLVSSWPNRRDIAYIAESAGKPVGAICGHVHTRTELPKARIGGSGSEPELFLAVLQEFRRKGVGYNLLKHLVKSAKQQGYPSVALCARDENRPAIRLYRKLAFAAVPKSGYTTIYGKRARIWRCAAKLSDVIR